LGLYHNYHQSQACSVAGNEINRQLGVPITRRPAAGVLPRYAWTLLADTPDYSKYTITAYSRGMHGHC
jgi:hypothetical protein